MIQAGIVGATGYTGVELLRLLALHPEVDVAVVTSRSEAGTPVTAMFPNLRGHLAVDFSEPDVAELKECDVVFFATPNGAAMHMVPELVAHGVKIIDLSADFRIRDIPTWEQFYGMQHACPELVAEAVYGLPEVNRDKVREARIVANPGCYPTTVQLGFMPLLKHDLVDVNHLIADVKSGVSGAGRKAAIGTLLCEASESMKAYGLNGHRHQPEIVQGLNEAGSEPVKLTFMPHLTPMIRGIQASLYANLKRADVDLQTLYETSYENEPFVDVLPAGMSPDTRNVRGTNMCQLSVCQPFYDDRVVILVVEDNLVKGAAGQAVQNMNIMLGLNESCGLQLIAVVP